MGEPITIYDVRENCIYIDDFDGEVTIESISQLSFQTMTSAQLYLQELLNKRLELRVNSAERFPEAYNNTPEAIAALAANQLHFDDKHYAHHCNIKLDHLPIFFIKELKVLY